MKSIIKIVCFYFPFVTSCLYLQVTIDKYVSVTLGQVLAYLNLALVLIGALLLRGNIGKLSKTNSLFFIFYILYYSFGLMASGVSGFQTSIIATFVPVIYFIGFYYFLSNKNFFNEFFGVITITLVISSFITIILMKMNISVYSGEVTEWGLDRAGGVTGDANAAAHTSIFAFLFLNQFYKPNNQIYRLVKLFLLSIIFYSLLLTFSTTGLTTFLVVLFIVNRKFFSGIKLIFIGILIPVLYGGVFYLKSQANNLNLSSAQEAKVDNLVNLLTLNFDKVDNSGRGELLNNILYYLYKNPLTGNGIDFSVFMRGHNTYIGIWVDAGLITFLFFIGMLLNYFYQTVKLEPKNKFFAIAVLLVFCIFMISLQSIINQPYLVAMIVFIGYFIDNNKEKLDNYI